MNTVINVINKNVLLRIVDEREFIVLCQATMNVYNNNVVISSKNDKFSFVYLMNMYQQYDSNYGLVQCHKGKTIHLLTDEIIIVLYSPVIERLELEDNTLKINLIADYIEPFFEPNTYIRRTKLEKIMERLKCKEKK